jgi:hypothetical protein
MLASGGIRHVTQVLSFGARPQTATQCEPPAIIGARSFDLHGA